MKKLFKARGIGLIGTMCLVMLVAFVFLVCPVIATANSTQAQDNQVIASPIRASAVMDQKTECIITEETDEAMAGTGAYEDTIILVNAIERLSMPAKIGFPEQRNFPLKTC